MYTQCLACMPFIDKPLEAEVDSESDKTVVSIPADHKLSELTPSSPSNTGPLRNAFLYDYLPADVDEVFFILLIMLCIILFILGESGEKWDKEFAYQPKMLFFPPSV